MKSSRSLVAVCLVLSLGFGGTLLFSDKTEHPLLPLKAQWQVQGQLLDSLDLQSLFDLEKETVHTFPKEKAGFPLFIAKPLRTGGSGRLVSPEFSTPEFLGLDSFGYPDVPGNSVFLERSDNHEKLFLSLVDSPNQWVEQKWHLPSSWKHISVRLIAEYQNSQMYLGISFPREVPWCSLFLAQIRSLLIFPIYILYFFLFFSVGLLLTQWIRKYREFEVPFLILLVIVSSSCIGYLSFWTYFVSVHLGRAFTFLLVGTLIFHWVRNFLKDRCAGLVPTSLRLPLKIVFAVGFFYLSILYGVQGVSSNPEWFPNHRFLHDLPSDNAIPKSFADSLFWDNDPRDMGGTWRSSDRPPLQTGIFLTHRLWITWTGWGDILQFQILGMILQCTFVGALFSLCQILQWKGRSIALVVSFTVFSGVFLLNSTFAWPKLLAAAFALTCVACLLRLRYLHKSQRPIASTLRLQTNYLALATVSGALALLSHGGAIFTLVPCTLLLLSCSIGWRRLGLAAISFVFLILPWTLYQKFYDPPGDRLIKMHLGGTSDVDSRSATKVVLDSYHHTSYDQLRSNKKQNFSVLYDVNELWQRFTKLPSLTSGEFSSQRTAEFFHLFNALGILNLGWVLWIGGLLLPKLRRQYLGLNWVLAISVLSIVFWVFTMFGPGSTTLHQGSYATLTLLFLGLGGSLAFLRRPFPEVLLGIQFSYFALAWIWDTPRATSDLVRGVINLPVALVGCFSIWVLFSVLFGLYRRKTPFFG